jgi:hypothetical protein
MNKRVNKQIVLTLLITFISGCAAANQTANYQEKREPQPTKTEELCEIPPNMPAITGNKISGPGDRYYTTPVRFLYSGITKEQCQEWHNTQKRLNKNQSTSLGQEGPLAKEPEGATRVYRCETPPGLLCEGAPGKIYDVN